MLLQIGKKLWTKKKENGSSDDKTRGITDALYSASLLRNISKLHWPPSTANHKTREVGKERAALQTRHRPPPNKVSVDSAIYVHISYSILKPRRQKRGKNVLCRCRMKAMHVRSSVSRTIISSLGACVAQYGWLQTERRQFVFFASHTVTNLTHAHIHGLKEFVVTALNTDLI